MTHDLELRLEPAAVLRDRLRDRQHEPEIPGTAAVPAASERVHSPHDFGREPDPGGEAEAAAVHAADADPARASGRQRVGDLPGRAHRVTRQAERPREHARPAARQEADRDVGLEPVQRLVEAAVAREDDHRVSAAANRVGHELRRVARPLGQDDVELSGACELLAHLGEPLLAHACRERVDDQRDLHREA